MTSPYLAWGAAAGAAALLALMLARGRMAGRLYLEALALGLTLGAVTAAALAPFELRANPLHFSAATLAFLFAGLPEEGIKLAGAAAFLRAHYLARGRADVVFAAGAMGLGFAGLENLFYLANAGAGWATLAYDRALTAVPFHVFSALAAGAVAARLKPGAGGVALGLAAWAGLAAIHGLYDFSVFAGAPGAAAPAAWARLVAALGLESGEALRLLFAAALAAMGLAGVAAVAALPPARGAGARVIGARGFGWAVGGLMVAAAGLTLLGAAAASAAFESADLFALAAGRALMPLALGLAFLVTPAPPASRPARWAAGGLSLAALAALVVAAAVWGPAQWRQLDAQRFQVRGDRLAARGDKAQALEAYSQSLRIAPERIEALSRRAAVEADLERFDAALADVDAALKIAPQLIPLYVQRAEIARRRNAPAQAAADYDRALALKPGDPELLALRSGARLEAGDPQGAARDVAEARAAAPQDPAVQRAAAALAVDAGDFDGALAQLNARLHADPADAVAAFQRGRVWLYKGEARRAVRDFQAAWRSPSFFYPPLWEYLARRKLREPGAFAALHAELDRAHLTDWPAPLARGLAERQPEDLVRAAAANADQRCEADFYLAADRWAAGLDAESGFAAAQKQCPTGFIEYEGAKAFLRRLGR
jgi:tetratricopeptide (TPR) repeat protein